MTHQRWAISSPDLTCWATARCPTGFYFWCNCVFRMKSWNSDWMSLGFCKTPHFSESDTVIFSFHFFWTPMTLTLHYDWCVNKSGPPGTHGQVATSILALITLLPQMWENNENRPQTSHAAKMRHFHITRSSKTQLLHFKECRPMMKQLCLSIVEWKLYKVSGIVGLCMFRRWSRPTFLFVSSPPSHSLSYSCEMCCYESYIPHHLSHLSVYKATKSIDVFFLIHVYSMEIGSKEQTCDSWLILKNTEATGTNQTWAKTLKHKHLTEVYLSWKVTAGGCWGVFRVSLWVGCIISIILEECTVGKHTGLTIYHWQVD